MESLKRLVEVLWAPTETFRRIRERPTWALALVVLLVLGASVGYLAVQKIDPDAQRQMLRETFEERQGLRGEALERQVDQVMAFNERFAPLTPLFGAAATVLGYLLFALVFYVAFRLAGGEAGFVESWATTVHAMVPQGLLALVAVPLLAARESLDPERLQSGSLIASNLGFLAPEDAPRTLVALLASVDLFTLWTLVLLILGFGVVARVSRGVATAVVLGGWVLWVGAKVGLAALFS